MRLCRHVAPIPGAHPIPPYRYAIPFPGFVLGILAGFVLIVVVLALVALIAQGYPWPV